MSQTFTPWIRNEDSFGPESQPGEAIFRLLTPALQRRSTAWEKADLLRTQEDLFFSPNLDFYC